MGLDMYFNKVKLCPGYSIKQCVNAPYYYDKMDSDDFEYLELTKEDIIKMRDYGVKEEDVAYFRKFNALHNWILQNVIEDGEDNVTYYEIPPEVLKHLLSDLQQVKDSIRLLPYNETEQYKRLDDRVKEQLFGNMQVNPEEYRLVDDIETCKEVLPTTPGFFFGSTVYDEWYAKDVEDAIEQLGGVSLQDDEILTYYAWY